MSKHRLESLTHRSYNVCCHSRPRVTLPQNGSVSGVPRDQGIQDIPRQSWRICHLNVIYVHRMLLLKIIALCVQEKDHIVQYMGICCTYLHIGMYNVNVLSFNGSHNVWQYGPCPMGCLNQQKGTQTLNRNCPLQAAKVIKVLFLRL